MKILAVRLHAVPTHYPVDAAALHRREASELSGALGQQLSALVALRLQHGAHRRLLPGNAEHIGRLRPRHPLRERLLPPLRSRLHRRLQHPPLRLVSARNLSRQDLPPLRVPDPLPLSQNCTRLTLPYGHERPDPAVVPAAFVPRLRHLRGTSGCDRRRSPLAVPSPRRPRTLIAQRIQASETRPQGILFLILSRNPQIPSPCLLEVMFAMR